MRRCFCRLAAVGACLGLTVLGRAAEYEVGGPLAGIKLPLRPTQHGEPPGYPGCLGTVPVPDPPPAGEYFGPDFSAQGQAPEVLLYDGAVEHYRAYMFKYMPIRSFFDQQSQLKNFVAPELPGAAPASVEQYAEPVYWVPRHSPPRATGRFNRPAAVVRMKQGTPVLNLDLGELPPGLYVVRVIGAVETAELRPFRKPLFLRMTVNDGPQGERRTYRRRIGYCDEFYSVGEFYFHAVEVRRFRAELAVARGSQVDLLVHNVSLDDVLAGSDRNPRPAAGGEPDKTIPRVEPTAERLARDADLWRAFPPLNAQGCAQIGRQGQYGAIRGVRPGTDELTAEEIESRYGAWAMPKRPEDVQFAADVRWQDVFLFNAKLKLVYTYDDLRHGRPLPDPYPLKDDGAGLYFPDSQDPATGAVWAPIGTHVHAAYREHYNRIGALLRQYRQRGQADHAHDAALLLVRWAYSFPAIDYGKYLSNAVHEVGPFGRDYACRRRETIANFLPHYPLYVKPIAQWYDELYDFIRDNDALAGSVGRFVPWVKTPDDVLRLLDVYFVQTTAKRILRYHYHTDPMDIANLATIVGDRARTDPWMEWLFRRTFIYPLPCAGIQDVMITGTTREGTEFVGSTYYAQGEGASRVAASLDRYLAAGGNPRYDLSDPRRYPKPLSHANWRLDNVVAGGDFLRVGDVCGPDKVPGHTLRDLGFARAGWRWSGDPRFAFILKHYLGRETETDREWERIESAAARQTRAPWLDNRSRVLPAWAGILETGLEHDDYRFRRAAYLRLGFGIGHEHHDALDLQVVAHGLPMTIDGGQRPGYTSPGDRNTFGHNVVQIDDHSAHRHSWATALADCSGARYLAAEAVPPAGVKLVRRQIALIDTGDGRRGVAAPTSLSPQQQQPFAELSKGAVTPNSYVLDVYRIDGGRVHTYCFHGPLNDDFQWNVANAGPPREGTPAAERLKRFGRMPELSLAAAAPEQLAATWRMAIEIDGPGAGEKEMLGRNFDPDSPRKYTRLHLLNTDGTLAMRGEIVCKQWGYHFTNLMVRRSAESGAACSDALVAVVEPFVGEPFLRSVRPLSVGHDVPGDASRSTRPVAVEVRTRGGATDVCFVGVDRKNAAVVPAAKLTVAGEFAYYSTDARGLRQVTLVGGKRLESPLIQLTLAEPERRAQVVRADYLDRRLWIDAEWPARKTPGVFEIGVPGHWTTYTAHRVEPAAGGALLQLDMGADYFRGGVLEVDPEQRIVTTALKPLVEYVDHNRSGWVASDDQRQIFWRAEYLGDSRFKLDGPPVSREAFGAAGVLRLWECGVGDSVRQSASVNVRRAEQGCWQIVTDAPVTMALPGQAAEVQRDGGPAAIRTATPQPGWIAVGLLPADSEYHVQVTAPEAD